MSKTNRIDVHTHLVPPFWGEDLAGHGGDPSGWTLPDWSVDEHLRYMDENGIETSVLSLTAPSVVGWAGSERREMARRVNGYVSDLVSSNGPRFGDFATVPLPDVDGAVAEVEYALRELGADGVVLLSNYGGVYLGDARFAPLWEALNAHRAVVFIHPAHPLLPLLDGVPGPLVDYPFDTTRNAVHMIFNGVLERYPDVEIILSHAGGFVPYSVLRFCELQPAIDPSGPGAAELLASFRQFYWDTALSSGRYAFAGLQQFADPTRILFGSDFPYAPEVVARRFNSILDTDTGLTDEQKSAIYAGNAQRLFERFA
ncbi:amidohydrolase family protein [Tsukamurella sp. 8F]|uniref:amidohydrolase family protein n=1 Tax=unclassified Tsukamurella TaxID=2633480 RepID=UPI0023B974CE|nr:MULTISPECIES: amidohydrolase family protein [unclassified Tsukamurella]MDF0532377.1 amidohydrolase family protein [Tsukamurella sp. 8J]MDF0589385.1 amidohydrolase family protein [Tsukamurella sp. 8F]